MILLCAPPALSEVDGPWVNQELKTGDIQRWASFQAGLPACPPQRLRG
jgi:hypothetical protein